MAFQRGLLYLVPASLLLVLGDLFLLDAKFRSLLPHDPNDYLLFAVVFTIPHIVFSFSPLVHEDVRKRVSNRTYATLQVAAVATALLLVLPVRASFVVFSLATTWHIVSQQVGIAILGHGPIGEIRGWKYSLALSVGCTYLGLATETGSQGLLMAGLAVAVFVAGPLTLNLARGIRETDALRYVVLVWLVTAAAALLALVDYPFFSLALPRVIHDLAAVALYTKVHSSRAQPKRALLSGVGAGALLSLAVSFAATTQLRQYLLVPLLFVTILHYLFEARVWKRDGAFRAALRANSQLPLQSQRQEPPILTHSDGSHQRLTIERTPHQ